MWVCISALMRVERTTPELSKFLLVASKQKLAMGDNDAEVDRTVSFWNVLKFNIYRLVSEIFTPLSHILRLISVVLWIGQGAV